MKRVMIFITILCISMGLASCTYAEDAENGVTEETLQQKQESEEEYDVICIGESVKGDYCIMDNNRSPLIVVAKNEDGDNENNTDDEDPLQEYTSYKYGAMNDEGDIVIPCEYDYMEYVDISSEESKETHRYHVKKDGLYGVIDENGNEIIPCEYACIIREDTPIVAAKRNDKDLFAFLSMEDGRQVTEPGFKDIGSSYHPTSTLPSPLIPVQFENNKWGYINYDGETVIEPKYRKVEAFMQIAARPFASVSVDGDKFGLIDMKGNSLLPCKFDGILDHADGLSVVYRSDSSRGSFDDPSNIDEVGVADKNGKMVIPFEPYGSGFSDVDTDDNGDHSQMELSNGKIIVNRGVYTTVDIEPEFVAFETEIYDSKGNPLTEGMYSSVAIVGENFIVKSIDNGKMGLLGKELKELLPCKYYNIELILNDVLAVQKKKGGPYRLTDLHGKAISGKEYKYVDSSYDTMSNDGYANVIADGKGGIIDDKGKEIIPTEFSTEYVEKNGDMGLSKGDVFCEPPTIMAGNLIALRTDPAGRFAIYDTKGEKLTEQKYTDVIDHGGDRYTYNWLHHHVLVSDGKKTGKYGVLDADGVEIAPCDSYSAIIEASDDVLAVSREEGDPFALAVEKDGRLVEITEPVFNIRHVID